MSCFRIRYGRLAGVLLSLVLTSASPSLATDDHLLLCEAVITPTESEFLEIANPTASDIALDDYYISDDEDYALLAGAFGGGPAPDITSSDFIARFPAGAVIPAGGVVTIAFDGAGFLTAYGLAADFELAGTDAGTPDMLEAFTGSIGTSRGLTNSGENAVLFFWDGSSDLVSDVDMVNIGTPSTSNDIADKTGLSVDGPDADTDASIYLTDAFTMPQQASDPADGNSTKRITLESGNEVTGGGNGLTGDDETSEQITTTWDSAFTLPDPGTCGALSPSEPMLVINEIDYDQDGTDAAEFVEIKNTGSVTVDLASYEVVFVNGNGGAVYDTIALPAVSLVPGDYFVVCGDAANVPNCDLDDDPDTNFIQNGAPDAVALQLVGGGVVDAVSYEGDTAGFTEGSGLGLEDDPGIDLASISRFPDGTDTDMNNVDLSLRCATPGEVNVVEASDCVPPAVPELVINEIDYDQDGTDAAEFVELKNVGAASVNLDAFTLELVNGNGAVIYQTIDLPDHELPAGGYFVVCGDAANVLNCDLDVSPDTNLIQNGAPDAVALMLGTAIVDTVSYEGDTAGFTEGSGAGLEDDPAVDFAGLSRLPDGVDTDMNDLDLSLRCITPGLANSSDAGGCAPPEPPMLVINEIDYDQSGTDAAEFIEIKNVGASAADLSGVAVELVNGNGGAVYDTIALPAVSLAAGDYFVVCANAGTTINCDLDDDPDTNFIQNGSPDAVALTFGGSILDAVSYEGDVPGFTEGSGDGLEDFSSVDFAGIARFPDGVDTEMNNVDLSLRCISPGEPNLEAAADCIQPVRSAIVINEIDYDQPSSDFAEFVELLNITGEAVDLDSWTLELVNGSSGAVYESVDLPAVSLAAGDYFVVCVDALTVPNCDLEAISSIQNGAPDAVALVLDGQVVEAVSYEGDTAAPYTEGSGVGLEDPGATGDDSLGISRFPDGTDTEQNNVDLSLRCVTPGGPNTSVMDDCLIGGPALEIHEIQGSGLVSPFEGSVVNTTDNVVTGIAEDGFFIQTPDARADGDVETSQGLFVFTDVMPVVSVGDVVDVRGEVIEFFDHTELGASPLVILDSTGGLLPAPVLFDETTPSPIQPQPDNEVERFEGMIVSFDGLANAPTDRFGDTATVAKLERVFREPGIEFPGITGLPVWDGNPELFEVDVDGAGLPDDPVFGNQEVSATGPLGFSFGDYQVLPTSLTLGGAPVLPRPVRDRADGELTIATQNVERLCDPDPAECSPVPATQQEYDDRLEKFSRQIREVLGAPDVVALQEVEGVGVLEDLAARIQTDDPTLSYSAWALPGNDVGGINVGYLTRDDTIVVNLVEQFGEAIIFAFDGSLLYDRPPLVLEADYIGTGDTFPLVVVNVHQRSLGGIDDPSDGDRVRQKRFEQAFELSVYIQGRQVADPTENLVVTGDFNAFQFTDGYVDVMGQITGNLDPLGALVPGTDEVDPDLTNHVLDLAEEERYSFIFGGSAQVLDHMLTSAPLAPFVTDVQYGRGNADAPASFDDDPTTALRSADHDGMVLFINLDPSLTLFAPEPGEAGVFNQFPVIGATPGGRVLLGGGRAPTPSVRVVAGCGPVLFDVGPRVNNFRFGVADATGVAVIEPFIPVPLAGRTVYFQAIDQATCELSNVVAVDFTGLE